MKTHIIEDGVVINTIIATVAEAEAAYPDAVCIDAEQHAGGVGWLWDGHALTPPPPPPAPQLPVPAHCTRRQGQLMLLSLGLLDDAEAAIAAIADPVERRAAQVEYDADTWERSNAFLSGLWVQLGGTSASLDDVFRTAVTL